VEYRREHDLPMWTTDELAKAGGVTNDHIARLCRQGRLEAWKIQGVWLIFDDSARRWLASTRLPGRPPKGSRPTGQQLELDLDNE